MNVTTLRPGLRRLSGLTKGMPSCVALAAVIVPFLFCGVVANEAPASSWSDGFKSRVRLIVGKLAPASTGPASAVLAGIEMEFPIAWKTYWRNPGDAGVPPSFDWSKSVNVAEATVLYPAPKAFIEPTGVTIGYQDRVVFPVVVTPRDPALPAALRLTIEYGVCKDICIPAQADIALDIAPGLNSPVPAVLAAAFDEVPRQRGQERAGDPVVTSVTSQLKGSNPHLLVDVLVPGGATSALAFLVMSDGGFMPLPVREPGPDANRARFVVDLSKDVDIRDLTGKTVLVTITGPEGASEVEIKIE